MKIKLKQVNYIYNEGTANEKHALKDVTLEIGENRFLAIAGNTGSGKSTLLQLLNGLKIPTSGEISYDGKVVGNDKKALREIRCRVGLVFQYPEYQLFDETVLKDVSFGPKNMGCNAEEARSKAIHALQMVELEESLYEKSPFDLSGGEKRRAAIAGILAMEPELLVLDEPTAGLDPAGKETILSLMRTYQEQGHTVLMVSHNMDEIAEYAQRVIVLSDGEILLDGDPHDVFAQKDVLKKAGLGVPQVMEFAESLGISGTITIQEAAQAITERYRKN